MKRDSRIKNHFSDDAEDSLMRRSNQKCRHKLSLVLKKIFKALRVLSSARIFSITIIILVCCIAVIWIADERPTTSREHAQIIIQNAEPISLITAAIVFLMEISSRRKKEHYEAWQVINSAQGKPGNGGRFQALQDLNKDGVSLEGVSVSKANLPSINLQYGALKGADFSLGNLQYADFSGADLSYSDLSNTNLYKANLSYANLSHACLENACLEKAKLQGTRLDYASLNNADLYRANLSNSWLSYAKLNECELEQVNLSKTYLKATDIKNSQLLGIILEGANFYDTDFSGSNINHGNLRGTKFFRIKLFEADLTYADLEGAKDYSGKILAVTKLMKFLSGAKLGATKLSDGTVYEPGFMLELSRVVDNEETKIKTRESELVPTKYLLEIVKNVFYRKR